MAELAEKVQQVTGESEEPTYVDQGYIAAGGAESKPFVWRRPPTRSLNP